MVGPSAAAGLTHPAAPKLTGFDVAELMVAGGLALLGVRSLLRWLRLDFPARGAGERVLYSLHVMARVGLWFAFALFFVGSALSEEPAGLRWYVLVLIALAGVQMLTTLALGRGGGSRP